MLKKTIKYKDLDGQETEVDAYFNLTKAEAIELNIRNDLEVIGRAKNQNEIMDTFHRILRMAYGVRTGDGRFIKVNPQGAPLYYEFQSTEAYSELFLEIFANTDYALEFIKAILPEEFDASQQASKSEVPEGLQNHPSMQGHQQPQTRREAKTLDNFDATPAVQPPAIATDPEYEEFLAQKRAREAAQTSAQVSPAEVPQTVDGPPAELI